MSNYLPHHTLLNQRYQIELTDGFPLGQGGFGITYRAMDTRLNRPVAVKEFFLQHSFRSEEGTVHPPTSAASDFEEFRAKVLQEARVLAGMKHPNIVNVHDYFSENGTVYFVMEWVAGKSLQKKGQLDEAKALKYTQQILHALRVVHQKGFVHRDVAPDNILITPQDQVVLVDFGAARRYQENHGLQMTLLVKPGFAAPEMYSDKKAQGPFSDIYSVGATLQYCLTGQRPPVSTDREGATFALLKGVSEQVNVVLEKALQYHSEDRYQSAEEMLRALEQPTLRVPTTSDDTHNVTQRVSPESRQVSKSPTASTPDALERKSKSPLGKVAAVVGVLAFLVAGYFIIAPEEEQEGSGSSSVADSTIVENTPDEENGTVEIIEPDEEGENKVEEETPSQPNNKVATSTPVAATSGSYLERLMAIADESKDTDQRLMLREQELNVLFSNPNVEVEVYGSDGETLVDYQTAQDYLTELAVTTGLTNLEEVSAKKAPDGKIEELKIIEVRN